MAAREHLQSVSLTPYSRLLFLRASDTSKQAVWMIQMKCRVFMRDKDACDQLQFAFLYIISYMYLSTANHLWALHPTQPNLIEFKRKLSCFILSRIFKSLTCCPRPEQSLILLAHHYWYHQLTNSRFYPDEFSMITSEINAASFSLMEIDTWPRASFHSLTLATRTSHRAEYSDLYHAQNQASPHFELSLC